MNLTQKILPWTTFIVLLMAIVSTFSLNSSSSTTTTTTLQKCHGQCTQHNHGLQIKVSYWFTPFIHYNLENIECLLHQTFLSWFADYEFSNTFESCDIHLIYIHGGVENHTLCNNPPCIKLHSKDSNSLPSRRRFLPQIDGNTTMTIIPRDADTAHSIESFSLDSMANAFEALFSDSFGVTFHVQIDVERQNEIESTKAYLIIIPIILCVLVCCGGAIVLYYYLRNKRNHKASQVSVDDANSNYQTKTDRDRDTIDYERQSITETPVLDTTQMVNRVNNPPMTQQAVGTLPVGSAFGGAHNVDSPFGGSYMPSSSGYRDGSVICAPQSHMNANNNAFNQQFPSSYNMPSGGIACNMPQTYDPIYAQQQQFGAAMGTFNEFNQFPQTYNQFPPSNAFAMNENAFSPQPKQEYLIVDDCSSNATSSMISFPHSDRNMQHIHENTHDSSTIMTLTNRGATTINALREESEDRTPTLETASIMTYDEY